MLQTSSSDDVTYMQQVQPNETQQTTQNPQIICQLQSKPINLSSYDPSQIQFGNDLGYPISNTGVPLEYYQQNPPPRAGLFENLFQQMPTQRGIQLTQSEESQTLAMSIFACCCPCATCSFVCCQGKGKSPLGQFCDSCSKSDCAFPFELILLIAIALFIVTIFVSLPLILIGLFLFGMYKIFTLRTMKIIFNEEKREIIATVRKKYVKKEEILSETIIPYDDVIEIAVVEWEEKKHYIFLKSKQDSVKINLTQFISNLTEKDLNTGVVFLKKYLSFHGVAAFQTVELP